MKRTQNPQDDPKHVSNRYRCRIKRPFLIKHTWFIAFLACLPACAPRLSAQEQAVRVLTDKTQVADCAFLGPVLGEERLIGGVLLGGQAEANALTRLRRETGRLGGDTVVVATSDTGISGSQVLGEAYRCAR